jgi:hypothetical protein
MMDQTMHFLVAVVECGNSLTRMTQLAIPARSLTEIKELAMARVPIKDLKFVRPPFPPPFYLLRGNSF